MVQKSKTRRGRPRAYDPDTALADALNVFWEAGYSGTSLDALSDATGMNRPSLYGAFGDKHEIYRKAIELYRAQSRVVMKEAFSEQYSLAEALRKLFAAALDIYLSGESKARGCFMIGTALTEAVLDDAVRAALADGFRELDKALEARMRLAQSHGELAPGADPGTLAKVASSVIYFLAIRSRAGEPRSALEAFARNSVDLICGPAKAISKKDKGLR